MKAIAHRQRLKKTPHTVRAMRKGKKPDASVKSPSLLDRTRKAGADFLTHTNEVGMSVFRGTKSTVVKISKIVDPAALGGAIAGIGAGEAMGGGIGGTLGLVVAGPPGALMGAQLGAFTGAAVGSRIGYDVTHDVIHPKDHDPNMTLGKRAKSVGRQIVRRGGDTLGSGAGAAGGAVVGTMVGGAPGGAIGAFIGSALVGDAVETRLVSVYDDTSTPKPRRRRKTAPKAKSSHTLNIKVDPKETTLWVETVARDTAIETGAEIVFGTLGSAVAGPAGQQVGARMGLVAARRVTNDAGFFGGTTTVTQTKVVVAKPTRKTAATSRNAKPEKPTTVRPSPKPKPSSTTRKSPKRPTKN